MSFQTALELKIHARRVALIKRRWRRIGCYLVRAAAMDDDTALRVFWCELNHLGGRHGR